MRTSAPCAFASSSVPFEPGTRIMSPKQVKITPGSCAIAMPSSTRPIGITHTGQPGPCTSSTFSGQQVVDAVLVDRVRVPAAHLHHLVVAARLDGREDLPGERPARARRRGTRRRTSRRRLLEARDRDAGVHQDTSPGRHRARPGRPPPCCSRRLSSTQTARSSRASMPVTRIATPSSPHVMQWPSGPQRARARRAAASRLAPHSRYLTRSRSP